MFKRLNRVFLIVGTLALTTICTGCQPQPGETRRFDGIEFQWCPPGTFIMGSPESEEGHVADEEPQHTVTLSRGFWLGRYEVTQAQWERVMGNNPSAFRSPNRPVEMVSWEDVQEFIAKLNAGILFGSAVYRLPTEAEWEYACRAGTSERFYWGEDRDESDIDAYAWYSDNSNHRTQPVGEKLPNRWGLRDMSGNVSEWCQDWFGDYQEGPVTDPQGPEDPGFGWKVTRGGSWSYASVYARSADRNNNRPESRFDDYGFRLLRTHY